MIPLRGLHINNEITLISSIITCNLYISYLQEHFLCLRYLKENLRNQSGATVYNINLLLTGHYILLPFESINYEAPSIEYLFVYRRIIWAQINLGHEASLVDAVQPSHEWLFVFVSKKDVLDVGIMHFWRLENAEVLEFGEGWGLEQVIILSFV